MTSEQEPIALFRLSALSITAMRAGIFTRGVLLDVALPLHQLGIAAMGLVLLDWPRLTDLLDAVATYRRSEFLLTVAPIPIPRATGSPVNPLATF